MDSNPTPIQQPSPKKLKMSTTTSDDDTTSPTTVTTTDQKPRYKRRKIAIFFAYCGVGYQGMQKNPGAKTIEGDLEEALFLSGAVPEPDRGKPQKYEFARSARTDKGVSAVGQVVSGRFYVDPPGLIDRLNGILPSQIRVFGFKRVTASFNAKKFCDRRRYVYLVPVFALDCNSHRDRESVLASLGSGNELVKCLECSERGRKVVGVMGRRNSESRIDKIAALFGLESNLEVVNEESLELGKGVEKGVIESVVGLESIIEVGKEENLELDEVRCNEGVEKAVIESGGGLESKLELMKEERLELDSVRRSKEVEKGVSDSGKHLGEDKMELDSVHCGNAVEKGVLESETSLGEEKLELVSGRGSNGEEKGVGGVGGKFCYGEKEKDRFNRILNCYVGTHNFHNFTTRIKAEDPSAQRYIISFEANSVVTVDGMDFVKCEVVGQSFMLHQIRKMIGFAVAIMRGCAPESLIETALKKDVSITVPTAPEVGLYLDECFFTSYNQKWKDTHEEVSMKSYAEEADDFKMKQIYSHIASTEQKEGAVAVWLHSLNYRNYPDLRFEGSNGTCSNGDHSACANGEKAQVVVNCVTE